ncbi:MAG: OsmC family protein [Bacteroidota bacterium]
MNAVYNGKLRCTAEHLQSGTVIETDAPTDNHGLGERFSPTDLVATALGTCILTTLALLTEKDGINLDGSSCSVNKVMASAPRRIAALEVVLTFTAKGLSTEQRNKIAHVAETCPVAKSLHPDLKQILTFNWPD